MNPNSDWPILLSDGEQEFPIQLESGAGSITEISATPSNIRLSSGGGRFGDFDPLNSHIEMRDWTAGRGYEYLTQDPSGYFDSKMAWTLTPGTWHQAPMWTHARGYNNSFARFPGNIEGISESTEAMGIRWKPILSTNHAAIGWDSTEAAGYTATHFQFVLRRFGRPVPLKFRTLRSSNSVLYTSIAANRPMSSLAFSTASLQATAVEELVLSVPTVVFTTGITLAASTNGSWIEYWTTTPGTLDSHWEFAGPSTQMNSVSVTASSNGSSGTWQPSSALSSVGTSNLGEIFFRSAAAPIARKWHFFELDRQMYIVDKRADGTAPTLGINGDRGKASSGCTSNTLRDLSKTWGNQWIGGGLGARAMIIRGTGAGQHRAVEGSASSGGGGVQISPAWDVIPTSDSEYIIYDTNFFTLLSTALASSIGGHPVLDVESIGAHAYFAFGGTTSIGKLRWNSSVHESAKESSSAGGTMPVAEFLKFSGESTAGIRLWRTISSDGQLKHARWNGTTQFSTNLVWEGAVETGSSVYAFTNLDIYNGRPYAFREDTIWSIDQATTAGAVPSKLNIGLDAFASSYNGAAVMVSGLYMYFGWSHSLERYYGQGADGTVDDIGDWQGAGLPASRAGPFGAVIPIINWVAAGKNPASSGIGAVQIRNDFGWHDIWRAPSTGYGVESLFLQSNPGSHPRLWISAGGEIFSIQIPRDTLNPLNSPTMRYWPEGIIETATIDMGVTQIPKLFSEIFTHARNLGSNGREVFTEYQVDNEIGSTKWVQLGKHVTSPSDALAIGRGDVHSIRFRFRALTAETDLPTRIDAHVLKAIARTPVKRQWNVIARMDSNQTLQSGLPGKGATEMYGWLKKKSQSLTPLRMRSVWPEMDGIDCFVEFPTVQRDRLPDDRGNWGGSLRLTIREYASSDST